MNLAKLFVRAPEGSFRDIVGPHPPCLHRLSGRGLGQVFKVDVTEYVVVEQRFEPVPVLVAGGDELIPPEIVPVSNIPYRLTVDGGCLVPCGKGGKSDRSHGVDYLPEIDKPPVLPGRLYAHGCQDLLHRARLAHLGRGGHVPGIDDIDRSPLRDDPCVDPFSAIGAGPPGSEVAATAPGAFPGSIGPNHGLEALTREQVDLGLHERAFIFGSVSPFVVPAGSCADEKFILSFPEKVGDIVGDDERPFVELRDSRSEHRLGDLAAVDAGLVVA